jgi:hypothetical protein
MSSLAEPGGFEYGLEFCARPDRCLPGLMMSLNAFLNSLFTTGELFVGVEDLGADPKTDLQILYRYESVWRTQQPLTPPAFHLELAVKAAKVLQIACRAVVHREITVEQTEKRLLQCALTASEDACDHYSVDLVMRFLPQVVERAARISEADPLLEVLRTVARPWPLSSVGMKDCEPEELPRAFQNDCLWRMYIDRIVAREDHSRLSSPSVRDAVAAAIGPFPQLAPEFTV